MTITSGGVLLTRDGWCLLRLSWAEMVLWPRAMLGQDYTEYEDDSSSYIYVKIGLQPVSDLKYQERFVLQERRGRRTEEKG